MIRWPWRRREGELKEELAAHFRMAVEDRIARGESRVEAEAAVRREFGSDVMVREATRRQWRGWWLTRPMRDFAVALRGFRRNPRHFLSAWFCIVAGVGATVTLFAVLDSVLLRPLPYADEDRLVTVQALRDGRSERFAQLTPAEVEILARSEGLRRFGTWRTSEREIAGDAGFPERVVATAIDRDLLALLGVPPVLGRLPADGEREAVVLSHRLWQRRFNGNEAIVGRTVEVEGVPHQVVGVMPERFGLPEGTELWLPASEANVPPDILFYDGFVGRIRPGRAPATVRAELLSLLETARERHPDGYAGTSYRVRSLRQWLLGPLERPILILQAAALLVLLIACANVAALQMARGIARRREFSVRAAIGAGRAGLASAALSEGVALALLGGAGAVLFSLAGLRFVEASFPDGVPSYVTLALHGRVLAAALVATLVSAVLFSIGPALRASRARARLVLAGSRVDAAGGLPTRRRLFGTLVGAEIALSVVLLTGSVLLVDAHRDLLDDLGFTPAGLITVQVPLGGTAYAEPQARAAFHDQLMQALEALPGVTAVSASFNPIPLDGPIAGALPFRMAHQSPERLEDQRVSVQWVESGYAQALGADLLDGRDLAREDTEAGSRGALVNRAFVEAHLAAEVAVGTYIHLAEEQLDPVRIVGVICDVRHERQPADLPPTVYAGAYDGSVRTFLVRAAHGDAASLAPGIRRVVRERDPTRTVSRLQTHLEVVERAFWRERLQRNVLSLFAGVALILALSGVYGVLSYMVAQRTHELGVRVALGASSPRIVQMVLREAGVVALAGVGIGLAGAVALNRVLAAEVHGLPAFHPTIAATVAGAVLAVALFAASGPARRAARLDPLSTLDR